MDILYKLGKTIEFLRLENNLTQRELGNLLGVTNQTISKWEIGESIPDAEAIGKLAKLFHMTVEELIESDLFDFKQQEIRHIFIKSSKTNYKTIFFTFIINFLIFILNKFNLNLDLTLVNKIAIDITIIVIAFNLIKTALKCIKHKITIESLNKNSKF